MQNDGVTDSCDWWLAMVTPFGAYFLALPDGLTTSVTPLYQGPLFGFGLTDLFTLPLAAVPEGTYAFYFGVDAHPDGEITPGTLSVDSVTVQITAGGNAASQFIEAGAGGSIQVTNDRGDQITLDIPAEALRESTTITLTPLSAPPANPIAANIFPGVRIQPEGVVLDEPAKLKIAFAEPVAAPERSLLFYLKSPEFVVPIGNQQRSAAQLEGEIYHFSTYTGGQPTNSEAADQALQIEPLVPELDSCWQYIFDSVAGLLQWAEVAQLSGLEQVAQGYIDQANEIFAKAAADFLETDVPSDPCKRYADCLFKYAEGVMSLLGGGPLQEQFQDRIDDLVNRCAFRGTLTVTERMDFGGCAHYTAQVSVPFNVEVFRPPYTAIKGGSESSAGSGSGMCGECPVTMTGNLAIRNLGGKLFADDHGNPALHFTFQVSDPVTITMCGNIFPLASAEWWNNEVVFPVFGGHTQAAGPGGLFSYRLVIKSLP